MTTSLEHRGASYLFQDAGPEEITTPEDMDEEQRMMMKSIRDFAEQEVMPVIDEVNARNIDVVRPLFKKAADLGIYMAEVPEEIRGAGTECTGDCGYDGVAFLSGVAFVDRVCASGDRLTAAHQFLERRNRSISILSHL